MLFHATAGGGIAVPPDGDAVDDLGSVGPVFRPAQVVHIMARIGQEFAIEVLKTEARQQAVRE